jgi:sugar phosphate isomerase/epimerase
VTSDPSRGPQLLCSTAAFFSRPLREAFEHISGAGFSGVEVMVTRDPDTQEAHRLRDLSEEHELAIRAIHAPFLLMTRTVWSTDPVRKIYRAIQLAEDLGVPIVVVHPPYRWQTSYRRWLDDRLPELSDSTGVRVAVENMFPVRLRGKRGVSFHTRHEPEELERFTDVVLDTSHAAVSGHDLAAAFRGLGQRVAHVHLSDNAGKGWDSHLPVGQGVLPLSGFLEVVAADGFSGAVSLELDLRRYLDTPNELREVLIANREFCEARLPQPA